MRYDMGIFLLIGFKNKQTKTKQKNKTKQKKTRTATQLCAKTSFKTYVKQLFQRVSVSYVQVTSSSSWTLFVNYLT